MSGWCAMVHPILWQVGNSAQQNGTFNMVLAGFKAEIIKKEKGNDDITYYWYTWNCHSH